MKRKQAFYEIGGGKFAAEAQELYEHCQGLAMQSNQAVTVTMKLVIKPPADGDRFGKTQYTLSHTLPAKKSIEFTTEYEGGYAIKDGDSIDGILQQDLFLQNT